MKVINHFRIIKAGFFGCILLLGVACSTASGPIRTFEPAGVNNAQPISRIYLPPDIEVLAIDGIEVKTPFIIDGFNEVQLLPGQHKVAVAYEKLWGDATSSAMVKSQAAILELEVTQQQDYFLKFPIPTDVSEAEALSKNFRPWLETSDRKHAVQTKMNVSETSMIGRLSGSSQASVATGGGVVNLTRQDKLSPGNSTMSAEEIVARQNPLDRLKFWWKLADKKDKTAFQHWLKTE